MNRRDFVSRVALGTAAGQKEKEREIYQKTLDKLEREPVEDFRIDFEDGYGFRSDDEEDGHAGHGQPAAEFFDGSEPVLVAPLVETLEKARGVLDAVT